MQSFSLNWFFNLTLFLGNLITFVNPKLEAAVSLVLACVTQIRGNVVCSLFFKVPTRAKESRARSLLTGSVFMFIIRTCD